MAFLQRYSNCHSPTVISVQASMKATGQPRQLSIYKKFWEEQHGPHTKRHVQTILLPRRYTRAVSLPSNGRGDTDPDTQGSTILPCRNLRGGGGRQAERWSCKPVLFLQNNDTRLKMSLVAGLHGRWEIWVIVWSHQHVSVKSEELKIGLPTDHQSERPYIQQFTSIQITQKLGTVLQKVKLCHQAMETYSYA
jgi:hypothetical protein